jgi:hypothetical protein
MYMAVAVCYLSGAAICYAGSEGQVQPEADAEFSSPLPTNMEIGKLLRRAFLLTLLVVLGLWLRNEVRIDSCLDHGGRWDKDQRICQGASE